MGVLWDLEVFKHLDSNVTVISQGTGDIGHQMIVLWDFVDSAWVLSITKNLEIMGILTTTKIAQDFMVSMEFLEIIGNHNCFTNTFRIKQRLGLTKLDFPFFEIPLQNENVSVPNIVFSHQRFCSFIKTVVTTGKPLCYPVALF